MPTISDFMKLPIDNNLPVLEREVYIGQWTQRTITGSWMSNWELTNMSRYTDGLKTEGGKHS